MSSGGGAMFICASWNHRNSSPILHHSKMFKTMNMLQGTLCCVSFGMIDYL
jgi:hypothetical protein